MSLLSRLRERLRSSTHIPLLPTDDGGLEWTRLILPEELDARARSVRINDQGHGIDPFGMSGPGLARGMALSYWLYEHYFRVISHGAERIPDSGRAMLACNHSGMLPLDALMVCHDVVRHSSGPRAARTAMDYFVPGLPWVNIIFSRAGGVGGSRGNFHQLLEDEELVLIFPEGVPGIGKPFSERYQLQHFREGFAELAIRHRTPVVPMCVVGAEEQWPQVARIEGLKLFGVPYLPVPATPVPLPVRYRIYYGDPIPVPEHFEPGQASDSSAVGELAAMVKEAVAALVEHGLAERKGIFS